MAKLPLEPPIPYRKPIYYDFKNKERCVTSYVDYMLSRTRRMFKYTGLPDTIPDVFLERYLQRNGQCIIAEHEGKLYAFCGGLGGVYNEYYFPSKYIVANPYLDFSKEYTIGEDCVLIRNDTEMQGLIPMCSKYASLLVENDLTMRIADINRRIPAIAKTHSDNQKQGFDLLMKRVEDGDLNMSIQDNWEDMFTTLPFVDSTTTHITEYIEFTQYIKAQWFNELGIRMSHNMKREALSASEIASGDDMIRSLPEDMLECRKEALDKINEMFGTNISIEYNSVWRYLFDEKELQIDAMEADIESKENSSDNRTETDEEVSENNEESEEKDDGEEPNSES